mgnify:CR=1 FL=1
MSNHKCFECGYETANLSAFIDNQTDGRHVWRMSICPQCNVGSPRVAPVGSTEYAEPVWGLRTSNYGVYVWTQKGNVTSSDPILPSHQLAGRPASDFFEGEQGTVLDLHHRLCVEGVARSARFKAAVDEARAAFPKYRLNDEQIAQYNAKVDELRKLHKVGDHEGRIEVRVA